MEAELFSAIFRASQYQTNKEIVRILLIWGLLVFSLLYYTHTHTHTHDAVALLNPASVGHLRLA